MIRTTLFLLACFFAQFLNAQGWTYLQGLPLQGQNDQGGLYSIEKVPGNGYVLAGYTHLDGQAPRPLLVRLDDYGNPILVRQYPNDSTAFHQAIPTSDGGYLAHSIFDNGGSGKLLAIHKLNALGDGVWSHQYVSSGRSPGASEDLLYESPNGEFVALFHAGDSTNPFAAHPRLVRLNAAGTLIQDTILYSMPAYHIHQTCQAVDGSFFISIVALNTSNGSEQRILRRIDATGQLLWEKFVSAPYFPADSTLRHTFCAPTADTGLVAIFEVTFNGSNSSTNKLVRYNSQGDPLWSFQLPTSNPSDPTELHVESLGILAMTSRYNNAKIWDLDLQGGLRNMSIIPELPGLLTGDTTSSYFLWNLLRADDGHVVVSGSLYDSFRRPLAMKLDSNNSAVANLIGGKVFKDSSQDCQEQSNEPKLRDWMIWANGNPVAMTDSSGQYEEFLGHGNFAITATHPASIWSDLWEFNCPSSPDSHLVNFPVNQADTLDSLDFAMVPTVECPLLYVDIGSPWLVRCDTAFYAVHYCNYGTAEADSAYIIVDLDSSLSFVSASIPYTPIGGTNSFRFDLGTIPIGDCGNFTLDVGVACDSLNPGRIHCAAAHIYPDSLCIAPDTNWSGASLQVVGECFNNDSVRFTVTNVGTANMVSGTGVWVVEDDILRLSGSLLLNTGQDTVFTFAANGSTWATLVEQVPFHPGPSLPRAILEGCGTDSSGRISLGYAGQFAEDDLPPYISIDCQEDRAAIDPNDKRGFPQGVGALHEIFGSDELEYIVRFQNTGNDTASKVIVRDRIPETLDLATIVMGARSHPYTVEIRDGNLVEWVFDPIVLPDSASNPEASQGFFRFSIAQAPNNPVGTRIENEVGIYFDYNAPVITASAWHTIRGPYQMLVTEMETPTENLGYITAYPNPFSESITFELQEIQGKNIRFELFDLSGRMVRLMELPNNGSFSVDRDGLPEGMYIYRLLVNEQKVGSGKILVQAQ